MSLSAKVSTSLLFSSALALLFMLSPAVVQANPPTLADLSEADAAEAQETLDMIDSYRTMFAANGGNYSDRRDAGYLKGAIAVFCYEHAKVNNDQVRAELYYNMLLDSIRFLNKNADVEVSEDDVVADATGMVDGADKDYNENRAMLSYVCEAIKDKELY